MHDRTTAIDGGRIVAREAEGSTNPAAYVVAGIDYGPGAGANDRATDYLDCRVTDDADAGPRRPPMPGDGTPTDA